MDDMERTVAGTEEIPELVPEEPADDAQAAEISAEQLIQSMNAEDGGETAEEASGDGDRADVGSEQSPNTDEQKIGKRIAAALRQQRRTIFEGLGMSEADVRELILSHKAEQMAKEDPDISPKAARRILQAQEAQTDTSAIAEGIRTLIDDGWTREELQAFTSDAQVVSAVNGGASVRQAAHDFLRRQNAPKPQQQPQTARRGKAAVPTMRAPSVQGADEQDPIAAMDDKQFARFADKAYQAMLAGKVVTF